MLEATSAAGNLSGFQSSRCLKNDELNAIPYVDIIIIYFEPIWEDSNDPSETKNKGLLDFIFYTLSWVGNYLVLKISFQCKTKSNS